jgi:hypothetical protein
MLRLIREVLFVQPQRSGRIRQRLDYVNRVLIAAPSFSCSAIFWMMATSAFKRTGPGTTWWPFP